MRDSFDVRPGGGGRRVADTLAEEAKVGESRFEEEVFRQLLRGLREPFQVEGRRFIPGSDYLPPGCRQRRVQRAAEGSAEGVVGRLQEEEIQRDQFLQQSGEKGQTQHSTQLFHQEQVTQMRHIIFVKIRFFSYYSINTICFKSECFRHLAQTQSEP
jgi:hypothetical protein